MIAHGVGPAKLEIAWERFGSEADPPVLLIMGVGSQMVGWHEDLCTELARQGLQVIRFDNRDVGLSTHLSNAPAPDFQAALKGDLSTVAYTLSDMAADTAGLLDALKLDSAHLVGASMGGFIAQTVAIEHPARVRSLTSMMSTTGNLSVGQPAPEALARFALPRVTEREQILDRMVETYQVLGSPAFPVPDAVVRARAALAFDRSYDPMGLMRQAVAVIASGDRTEKLKQVQAPTLVIHGSADKMCNVSGGRATAEAIPGATLEVIEGLGHNLPPQLWKRFAELISAHVFRAEARAR